jgi:hypothetical protein
MLCGDRSHAGALLAGAPMQATADRIHSLSGRFKGSYTVYTVTVVVSCQVFDMRSFNESKTSEMTSYQKRGKETTAVIVYEGKNTILPTLNTI